MGGKKVFDCEVKVSNPAPAGKPDIHQGPKFTSEYARALKSGIPVGSGSIPTEVYGHTAKPVQEDVPKVGDGHDKTNASHSAKSGASINGTKSRKDARNSHSHKAKHANASETVHIRKELNDIIHVSERASGTSEDGKASAAQNAPASSSDGQVPKSINGFAAVGDSVPPKPATSASDASVQTATSAPPPALVVASEPASNSMPVTVLPSPHDVKIFLDPNAREFTPPPPPLSPMPFLPQAIYFPGHPYSIHPRPHPRPHPGVPFRGMEMQPVIYGPNESFSPGVIPLFSPGHQYPIVYPPISHSPIPHSSMSASPSPSPPPPPPPPPAAFVEPSPVSMAVPQEMGSNNMPRSNHFLMAQHYYPGPASNQMRPNFAMNPIYPAVVPSYFYPSYFHGHQVIGRDKHSRVLLLNNVPLDVPEAQLRVELEDFGAIRSLELERRAEGMVIVHYFDIRSAEGVYNEIHNQSVPVLQDSNIETASKGDTEPATEPDDKTKPATGGAQSSQTQAVPPASGSENVPSDVSVPPPSRTFLHQSNIFAQFIFPVNLDHSAHMDILNQGVVVVSNIDDDFPHDDIVQLFKKQGDVREVKDGQAKRQKFVEFYDIRDAEKAVKVFDGSEIGENKVKVEISRISANQRRTRNGGHGLSPIPSPSPPLLPSSAPSNLQTVNSRPQYNPNNTSLASDSQTKATIEPSIPSSSIEAIPTPTPAPTTKPASIPEASNALSSPNHLPNSHDSSKPICPVSIEDNEAKNVPENLNDEKDESRNNPIPPISFPPNHGYFVPNYPSFPHPPSLPLLPHRPSYFPGNYLDNNYSYHYQPSSGNQKMSNYGDSQVSDDAMNDMSDRSSDSRSPASAHRGSTFSNKGLRDNNRNFRRRPYGGSVVNVKVDMSGNKIEDQNLSSNDEGEESQQGQSIKHPYGARKNPNESFQSEYVFDEFEAEYNQDYPRTTLMIKNIPNKYSQGMLLALLDAHCLRCNSQNLEPGDPMSAYDFVYLPIDFKNRCNLGYAFVNFTSIQATLRLYRAFHAQQWEAFNSRKICQVTYARVQGRSALEEHFRNSRFACDTDEYLPLIFSPPRNGINCPPPIVAAGHMAGRTAGTSPSYSSFRRNLIVNQPFPCQETMEHCDSNDREDESSVQA